MANKSNYLSPAGFFTVEFFDIIEAMNKLKTLLMATLCFCYAHCFAAMLPKNFVYLNDIDSSIIQEMRYFSQHNFVGRPITGYHANTCILTRPAAIALSKVQQELMQSGLSLKVYDCYRPQKAVNDFIHWSKQVKDQKMKIEFYPKINKARFFELGYVAKKSGHTRGSTVDLTIVAISNPKQANYVPGQRLYQCFLPYNQRFQDNSIDMGTGFDCLDPSAHFIAPTINLVAKHNRSLLREVMEKYGFTAYINEWWHFTLANEPFPEQYLDFDVI